MLDGKALRAGCIRYWTCRRIGRIPKTTRRSNRDWDRPALAAFLHITTGPSWQWSPTRINYRKNNRWLKKRNQKRNKQLWTLYTPQLGNDSSLNRSTSNDEAPTCLAPRTTGTMHSGSVACVLSSIRMDRNCILARRGSPAPTQVQQITSAFWEKKRSTHKTLCFWKNH